MMSPRPCMPSARPGTQRCRATRELRQAAPTMPTTCSRFFAWRFLNGKREIPRAAGLSELGTFAAGRVARIMAIPTLPLATVRDRLSSLVDDVTRTHDTLTITRNGTPAAVVLSVDDYDSIMETLTLVTDPIDRERLDEAERSVAAGDVTAGEDMARLVAKRVQRPTGAA